MSDMIQMAKVVLGDEEIEAVTQVLRSGNLRQGSVARRFEEQFAAKVGAKHATTFSNGTTALFAVYGALFEPGDEVLVPSFTFFASAAQIAAVGAVPVFCEVDPRTFTIDPQDAERRITPRTKGIVGVHLFGLPCDIEAIVALASKHDLKVVWDAAQAHLAKYDGRDIGSFGHAVCYSFYATKNMTTGEGGMITSDSQELIDQCVLLKQQGQAKKYYHTVLGGNFRMTDYAAAIGLAQLERIEGYTADRQRNAELLTRRLVGLAGITVPQIPPKREHVFHLYTILVEPEEAGLTRDELASRLKEQGVGSAANYPVPTHRQPAFSHLAEPDPGLGITDRLCEQCLSIPVHPLVQSDELERIALAMEKALG